MDPIKKTVKKERYIFDMETRFTSSTEEIPGGSMVTINIVIPYSQLQTFQMPESCNRCPCGYSDNDCGRNVPFTDRDYEHRPDTCKLQRAKILDIIKENL